MNKKTKGPTVNEAAVLFPAEQVGPYTIYPWTLTQFGQAFAVLKGMIEALEPLGLSFENVEDLLVRRWVEIIPLVLPWCPRLIEITLRLPPAEIEPLDAGTLAALGLRILLQNREQLKNFLTLALGGLPGMMSATPLH